MSHKNGLKQGTVTDDGQVLVCWNIPDRFGISDANDEMLVDLWVQKPSTWKKPQSQITQS